MSNQQVLIFGEPIEKMPKDLYIPPEALRVLLTEFEGPLDLLLYLIKKHKMDIFDIHITLITQQYLAYIEMMERLDIALAAEYLLMAATLADIKARLLLPVVIENEEDEEIDPRMALVDRLLIYAKVTKGAQLMQCLPRLNDGFAVSAHHPPRDSLPLVKPKAEVGVLKKAMLQIQSRQLLYKAHDVDAEVHSLNDRMQMMQEKLSDDWVPISSFYSDNEGKAGLIVSVMAMLELDRSHILKWRQASPFADILLRLR